MDDLMLHVMDLAMNSVAAGCRNVRIRVEEDPATDRMRIRIADDGLGMTPEVLAGLQSRLHSTREGRKRALGLGIALLRQAAESCGGSLLILSRPGKGTLVKAEMRLSHIDRPPMGDCAATVLDLVIGNPAVRVRFTRARGDRAYTFDGKPAVRALGHAGLLRRPEVIRWVRMQIEDGERGLAATGSPHGTTERPQAGVPTSRLGGTRCHEPC